MSPTREVNFDGVVGPTHHYGGLAHGNLASMEHRHAVASPKAAALQGLAKMKQLADRGFAQAVLPPQPRPALHVLRSLGFSGCDADLVRHASREAPDWLSRCYSASSMWAANAATVSPSPDTRDGRLHLTPANLISQFHRSIEPPFTETILRYGFADPHAVSVHAPLPAARLLADEGAANHLRLTPSHDQPGLEVFVFGQPTSDGEPTPSQRFEARQTQASGEAIARRHQLSRERTCFIQQNPTAIDAGVFHNDVISVANENVLLYHEHAFADAGAIDQLRTTYQRLYAQEPVLIEVPASTLSLDTSVSTYLFNSQLLTRPEGGMLLLCPEQCRAHPATARWLADIVSNQANPIDEVGYVDLRQSMQNGGGPACLRLRIVLTEPQQAALPSGMWLDGKRYEALRQCVAHYWRDQLHIDDLADPALIDESRQALEAVCDVLGMAPFAG
jgi:succinylarginine dihydrolase